MALLVRIARHSELPYDGGKLVKEAHGRKILLVRKGSHLYATDAHCYHMGGALWEGDIEDVGGHTCVVCPLHRHRISMSTGQKVDTLLDGCITCTPTQQQRTYTVREDGAHIWVDIPQQHTQSSLPSDRYNPVLPTAAPTSLYGATGTPPRTNYGLLGASSRQMAPAPVPEPLAPYAGFQQRGLVPATPDKSNFDDEGAVVLSQGSGLQLSQAAASPLQQQQQQAAFQQEPQQQAPFQQQQQPVGQGQIPFTQSRMDAARLARRKAATEAIMKKMYQPPTAPPQQPPAAKRTQGSTLSRTTSGAGSGQQSLLSFGFTVQQRSPLVPASGAEDMDLE